MSRETQKLVNCLYVAFPSRSIVSLETLHKTKNLTSNNPFYFLKKNHSYLEKICLIEKELLRVFIQLILTCNNILVSAKYLINGFLSVLNISILYKTKFYSNSILHTKKMAEHVLG